MVLRDKLKQYNNISQNQFLLITSILILIIIILINLNSFISLFNPNFITIMKRYESLKQRENELQNLLVKNCDSDELLHYKENSLQYNQTLGLAEQNLDHSNKQKDNNQNTPSTNTNTRTSPLNREQLINRLKNSTVLIINKMKNGRFSSGTGFFISNNLIITNHHVIEDSDALKISNKTINKYINAEIVVNTPSDIEKGEPDFALLKVDADFSSNDFLPISDNPPELSQVISVGFPGAVIQSDNDLIPNTVFSEGNVSVIQKSGNIEIVIHSANISPGSSGGPLVNRCGFVVGVNSGVTRSDYSDIVKASLAPSMLKNFLIQNHVDFIKSNECTSN